MPAILLLVSGPALAGKSTFIKMLSDTLEQPFTIVSSDDIRQELYGHYNYDPANEPHTWQVIKNRINQSLAAGHLTILDSTLRTREKREEQWQLYKGQVPIVLFAFEPIPDEVLLARNAGRTWKQFSEATVRRLNREYVFPTADEFNHYSKVINITNQPQEAIAQFHQLLSTLGNQYVTR